MASIVVRFPDGTKEFRFPETMLEENDVIWHAGERFRVISVQQGGGERAVVTVEPASGMGDVLLSEEGAIRLTPLDDRRARHLLHNARRRTYAAGGIQGRGVLGGDLARRRGGLASPLSGPSGQV